MKLFACSLLLLCTTAAHARITRIEIQPTHADAKADVPESYRVYQGLAHGEVDPNDAHNRIITDLALAPRNAHGMVEYTTTFTLYAPARPMPDAVLRYDVVNRGHRPLRNYATGDFFLVSGWQGDLPFEQAAIETIQVPTARNANGSPITGPAVVRWIDEAASTKVLTLSKSLTHTSNDAAPAPLNFNTAHAHLFTKQHEAVDGTVTGLTELPADAWKWGDCKQSSATQICLKDGFNPALLYELRYTAKDPLVLGLGFAATRDLVTFFRNAKDDGHGFTNPVAGRIKGTIATGVSQSGNYLRSFLNLGFNQAEDNTRVFDGVMPIISARQVPLNVRFGTPGGTSMLFEIGTDGADWYAHTTDTVRHNPAAGELDRCTASHTCPKIVEVLGSAEFYSLRASMSFVGTDAKRDLPLPANVRRFYVAGTSHGGGPGGFSVETKPVRNCTLAANPNPQAPFHRALYLALKQWVISNTMPPDSLQPSLAQGTLKPSAEVIASYPSLLGATPGIFNPNFIYRLGPQFHAMDLSGTLAQAPPEIIGIAPSVLPVVDANGNEIGGLRTPLLQNPLGTYTGWNPTSTGFRKGEYCSLTGGFIPFDQTPAERNAAHDPRASLAERYKSHEDYVQRVRASAEKLVAQRLLLREDADLMVQQAAASSVLR